MPEQAVLQDGGALWKVGTDSLRALQAGLASLFLLFTALATFGPWFQIAVAHVLTAGSIVVGLAGLRWAHRASHSAIRRPGEAGRGFATVGWLTSFLGIVISGVLNGAVLYVLQPVGLLVALVALLMFIAFHEGARAREAFFLGRFDRRDRTSTCASCGRRALVDAGGWGRIGWMCARCSRSRRTGASRKALRGLLILSAASVALLIPAVPAQAFCEILEPPTDLPTEVKGTQIEIRLTEGFARVVIIKEFFNPSDRVKEGQIFFPLEKGHELITDLSLKIGNVVYAGSGQDRQGALDDFLDSLANGKDAALVQYDPPRDVYWLAVTIPPGESRTTITTLEMPLTMRDEAYTYDYRLSVDAGHSREYLRLHLRVETSAPMGELRIPTHPAVEIKHTGTRIADAWINGTEASLRRDLRVQFRSSGSSIGQFATTAVVHNATVRERYLRFSLDAGDPAFADSLSPLPRSFIVLLDASGSMGLRGRWDLARNAVFGLGGGLRAGEGFAVAAFHGNTVVPFAPGLQEWDASTATRLATFLNSVEPRGSTSLTVALPIAAQWGRAAEARGQQPVLFLISDGRPTVNTVPIDIETAYRERSYQGDMPVFALAIEPAIHADENLLRNVSHFNHGDLITVHPGAVDVGVLAALSLIRVPVLVGVGANFPGAENLAVASHNPQDVPQGGESVVIAKLTGTTDDPVTVELTWTAPDNSPRVFTRTYAGPEIPVQPLLKKTWVLTRVHALLEEIASTGDKATIAELTSLATANRIVTPYTSILVTIPTTPPPGTPSVGSSDPFGLDLDLFGGGTLQGPGATGSGSGSTLLSSGRTSRTFDTPLDEQARETQRFWDDVNNPLLAEHELDRLVREGSPEQRAIEARVPVLRSQGQSLSVFEVDGELVGVYGRRLDPGSAGTLVLWNGAWGMAAVIAMLSFLKVPAMARTRPPRKR